MAPIAPAGGVHRWTVTPLDAPPSGTASAVNDRGPPCDPHEDEARFSLAVYTATAQNALSLIVKRPA
jgi:hypothetical protein